MVLVLGSSVVSSGPGTTATHGGITGAAPARAGRPRAGAPARRDAVHHELGQRHGRHEPERLEPGEPAGEIRMNCINNFVCAFVDGRTLTFAAPRAEISFGLTLVAGHVQFTDVSTSFSTGNTDSDSIAAGHAIETAITQHINGDPGIRSAVSSALDTVVRIAGRLGFTAPTLAIDALTLSGNTMTIQPGCAEL
jgi:hypothetical protein